MSTENSSTLLTLERGLLGFSVYLCNLLSNVFCNLKLLIAHQVRSSFFKPRIYILYDFMQLYRKIMHNYVYPITTFGIKKNRLAFGKASR